MNKYLFLHSVQIAQTEKINEIVNSLIEKKKKVFNKILSP